MITIRNPFEQYQKYLDYQKAYRKKMKELEKKWKKKDSDLK